ncbi:cation-translocating P-type ATPase [Pelobacter propionicus]|uniref:ATPase, P-type (Transporting), HAD superfamily, subfamily IC n=1 Tax=Pelobacter propionicus (strain DSM 2379 / NBRC 103807 / OttBd1) TaxID=338966 RepID=A1ARZ4_PELPD|nr:cation-translocating P-type ATPase [Pelobacter propionicus]ABL00115.1 ATPase, P-type (transporting), HAD superfamily, subfamily IC [Pelobacter propionicus DSM 2379]
MEQLNWHLIDAEAALERLASDPEHGLSSEEAARRLATQGANELQERGGTSPWRILWEQFTSTMALILISASLLSALVGSLKDTITILAIVCLFALLGFVQEYRAERAIRALKRLAMPNVRLRRDGSVVEAPAAGLVPGDILLLEAGNLVPADCRLIESYNLKIQEALLTGESEAVEKISEPLRGEDLALGDRRNLAYSGTTVSYGRGVALVVATGMSTELGRIATMLQAVTREWTPLQRRLDRLGKVLAAVAVLVSVAFFVIGMLRGEDLRLMLLTAVSLAVAAIPEGLPAVVTITLAIGAQGMLRRNALIRKLPAVETLGSVTVICSDKTGTLTENRMTVTEVVPWPPCSREQLLYAAALCNDASERMVDGVCQVVGDPTEGALLVAASQAGISKNELEQLFPRVAEIPFDSASKRMVTVHSVSSGALDLGLPLGGMGQGERFAVAKGAVDVLLPLCGHVSQVEVMERVAALASSGMRVLACAGCRVEADWSPDGGASSRELTFMGLIAMMDPPRPEARDAVERCARAGIRPVMITGDHPLTAAAIAGSLGIGTGGGVVVGAELDRRGAEGLADIVGTTSVYARVSPAHKLLIVEALRKSGQVVAMTGDGVNDAPALKRADIGVAMGITGTDVAKESSDMVLLDDNFATIVASVEEGRTIYDNIRKFIEFSVAGNLGKILAVVTLPFLGLPMPLTPLQLLWLNLLTDGLLGLGMGMERAEPDIMDRPPISPSAQIFDRRMLRHSLLTGGVIAVSSIALARYFWLLQPDGEWQTVLFSSLAFAQIGQALALRSFGHSLFSIGFFTNPVLLCMVLAVVLLQGMVVYLPTLQPFFTTVPLAPESLVWVLLPGTCVFGALEVEKVLRGRRPGTT